MEDAFVPIMKFTIDGVDIECYDPSWLRGSATGLINQVMLVVHSSMAMMVKIVDIYYWLNKHLPFISVVVWIL